MCMGHMCWSVSRSRVCGGFCVSITWVSCTISTIHVICQMSVWLFCLCFCWNLIQRLRCILWSRGRGGMGVVFWAVATTWLATSTVDGVLNVCCTTAIFFDNVACKSAALYTAALSFSLWAIIFLSKFNSNRLSGKADSSFPPAVQHHSLLRGRVRLSPLWLRALSIYHL